MSKFGQNAPSPEQMAAFQAADWDGLLYMINLLKFKDQADYAGRDEPARTGLEAYQKYGERTGLFLQGVGGKPLTMLHPQHIVIGDENEDWDEVIIVEYPSREKFVEMASNPDYIAITYHLTAALARSALIASKKVF